MALALSPHFLSQEFSQPQCSPSLQTLHVFFYKKLSIYITVEAFPGPRPSGPHPPPDRVTHPGERSEVGGGAGWLPVPKSPPTTTTQAPESQGPSLGRAANWDAAKRWYLLLTSSPTGSHLRSGTLPEAISAVSREPSGLQASQAPSGFQISFKDMQTWIWIAVQFKPAGYP